MQAASRSDPHQRRSAWNNFINTVEPRQSCSVLSIHKLFQRPLVQTSGKVAFRVSSTTYEFGLNQNSNSTHDWHHSDRSLRCSLKREAAKRVVTKA